MRIEIADEVEVTYRREAPRLWRALMLYTLPEIARIIGSTRSAVSVHLDRGRKRLRSELGDSDG